MSDLILAGTRKGLVSIRRAGAKQWKIDKVDFLADNVGQMAVDLRDGARYAVLDHGHFGPKLHRSDDGGKAWNEITLPAYPPKPEGDDQKDMWGKPIEWKLNRIWELVPGHASEPGVLWAGTLPGALFRSSDKGQTWEMIRTLWDDPKRKEWFGGGMDLPGIHSICVDPRDGKRVTLGISCGGVWQTTDGGKTWACRADGMRAAYMPPEKQHDPNIQDPHRVVQCAAKPDCFWAQHHNGIFRTTDGLKTWQEIPCETPANFGFAVAVHPRDPETAWFVPGVKDEKRVPVDQKVVVTRTRDGGKSFEILRNGLPQEHAFDIVYRHCLAIDGSGQRLAMGSTTGSLWTTEDGGDSWQAVSSHLAPIYSVQFA
jgi:photosystem II stability/assembly factor-like uncharacterized protein